MSEMNEIRITADSHVGQPEELLERIPEELRKYMPELVTYDDQGGFEIAVEGYKFDAAVTDPLTEMEWGKEFRDDASEGRDLTRRLRDMAREGVDAQVVFPNEGLLAGSGEAPPEARSAWARAYNDWAADLFFSDKERFCAAAMIPIDCVEAAVAEARYVIDRGFKTLFLPPSVPWQPYYLDCWEPLWSMIEEAGIVLNFHVFAGNLAVAADFAHILHMDEQYTATARRTREAFDGIRHEMLSGTVIGMAAGMGPIVHLTGSGVLERHPDLRFIVTEGESGWLAFALQQMDRMQDRRHMYMRPLDLKPSEYFLRQGHVTITDDPAALMNTGYTGCDCILWGNDYPHDEGTYPDSERFIDDIKATVSEEDARKILFGNAARLFGFDLARLATRKSELHSAP